MSITKIMVENWDSGTPSVSTVVFAGQSQISSGMTVLQTVYRQTKRGAADRQHRLYGVLHYAHGRFEIERLIWGEIVEEDLLDGCFSRSN